MISISRREISWLQKRAGDVLYFLRLEKWKDNFLFPRKLSIHQKVI